MYEQLIQGRVKMDWNRNRFILNHGTDNELSKKLSKELKLTNEDAKLFASILSDSDLCFDKRKTLGIVSEKSSFDIIKEDGTPHSCLMTIITGIVIIIVIIAVLFGKLSTLFGIGLIILTLIIYFIIAKLTAEKHMSVGPLTIDISKTTLAILSCLLGFTPLGNLSQIGECLKDIGDSINKLTTEEKVLLSYLKEAHKDIQTNIRIEDLQKITHAKNPLIKSKEELNQILDSLAEKDLIKIRMETIIV